MTNDELRSHAERLVYATEMVDALMPRPAGQMDFMHAESVFAKIWLAENPTDSDEPVTEDWLSITFGPHLSSSGHKRYSLCFAVKNFAEFNWCPPCGNLPQCVCFGRAVVIENPSRGDIRRLCHAMRIDLKEK